LSVDIGQSNGLTMQPEMFWPHSNADMYFIALLTPKGRPGGGGQGPRPGPVEHVDGIARPMALPVGRKEGAEGGVKGRHDEDGGWVGVGSGGMRTGTQRQSC